MNNRSTFAQKILGAHEDQKSDAGLTVESHREILDRQFWAAVPESGGGEKCRASLGGSLRCIPPKNVQSYVNDLIKERRVAEAVSVLKNYAACAESEKVDGRRKAATVFHSLRAYAKTPQAAGEAMRH